MRRGINILGHKLPFSRSGQVSLRVGAGFTVTELMVAISLMGVIIFALTAVFNQTQKALRRTEIQNDISEKGRSVLELVTRELEQVVATNFRRETNFYVALTQIPVVYTNRNDPKSLHTNVLNEVFLQTRSVNQWAGIGFRVVDPMTGGPARDGIGSLERFTPDPVRIFPIDNYFSRLFVNSLTATNNPAYRTNFHHIAQGVVHFQIKVLDLDGRRLGWDTTNINTGYPLVRLDSKGALMKPALINTASNIVDAPILVRQVFPGGSPETSFAFRSNALPAFLEFELGIIDPETFRNYLTMRTDRNPNAGAFALNRLGKVQLFRQLIPIRQAAQ